MRGERERAEGGRGSGRGMGYDDAELQTTDHDTTHYRLRPHTTTDYRQQRAAPSFPAVRGAAWRMRAGGESWGALATPKVGSGEGT